MLRLLQQQLHLVQLNLEHWRDGDKTARQAQLQAVLLQIYRSLDLYCQVIHGGKIKDPETYLTDLCRQPNCNEYERQLLMLYEQSGEWLQKLIGIYRSMGFTFSQWVSRVAEKDLIATTAETGIHWTEAKRDDLVVLYDELSSLTSHYIQYSQEN